MSGNPVINHGRPSKETEQEAQIRRLTERVESLEHRALALETLLQAEPATPAVVGRRCTSDDFGEVLDKTFRRRHEDLREDVREVLGRG